MLEVDISTTDSGLRAQSHLVITLSSSQSDCNTVEKDVPYFFGYKTEVFSFQNNPKDLDPSCKTDLDLWDCLGRVKLVL